MVIEIKQFEEVKEDLTLIKDLLIAILEREGKPSADNWMNADELCQYLPSKPSKTTIYGWVQNRTIPFTRQGKCLLFSRDSIDKWLLEKATKTSTEIASIATSYPTRVRRGGRRAA